MTGQNNPAGVEPKTEEDVVPFTPYATAKDLVGVGVFAILFAIFVFYMPTALGHADNFIPANALVTPPHIVPEWYLLPFYAILRAVDFNIGPIDSKFGGVIAMFGSIAVLFVLPWLDTSKVRSMRYRPIARQFFLIFVVVCIALGWCGGQAPDAAVVPPSQARATLAWVEGGEVREVPITAADANAMQGAVEEAEASLRAAGASIVYVERSGATQGVARGAIGGTQESVVVTGSTVDALEEQITLRKATLPAGTPFVQVTRELPFVFNVTRFSQVLTAYYFLFFLVILPVLGLRETPNRVPETIAKAIAAKHAGAKAQEA